MGLPANFTIVCKEHRQLVIRDVGPWGRHFTVTNDVENVVKRLAKEGHLPPARRLFYYDSEGQFDEILVLGGEFVGFKPGPRKEAQRAL